jgi:hypothetical protein
MADSLLEQKWEDCTARFRQLCGGKQKIDSFGFGFCSCLSSELPTGYLVRSENFSLHEAMSAVELMDPKMDAGMNFLEASKRINSFEDSVAVPGLLCCLMFQRGLQLVDIPHAELVGIFDDLIAAFVAWLKGDYNIGLLVILICSIQGIHSRKPFSRVCMLIAHLLSATNV